MGRVGVVGGLGKHTTARLLELLSRQETCKDVILRDFPQIPDVTGCILGSLLRSPLPGLLWAGRELAREGAERIVLPCMAAHYFYPQLCEQLPVPVLHGPRETVRRLQALGVGCAGVLTTTACAGSGIFSQELQAAGIRPVLPGQAQQRWLQEELFPTIKAGETADVAALEALALRLRQQGAETVILGCGELSGLLEGQGYTDVLSVLAACCAA